MAELDLKSVIEVTKAEYWISKIIFDHPYASPK